MSFGRVRTGAVWIAIALSLSGCGSTKPPPLRTHPVFQSDYLATSTIVAAFRAHGILLQKTFGDNLQSSYDGISASSLGLHVVGLIVYPPETHGSGVVRSGAGGADAPITIDNVEIWIVPGLPKPALADAQAAITKLTAECRCANSALSLLSSMVTVKSGEWSGERWTLRGTDVPDGRYCVELAPPGSLVGRSGGCGTIYGFASGAYYPQNMSVAVGLQSRLLPGSVFGVIVSIATKVEISFTNGTTETVPTIGPPPALTSGLLDFYIARRPCGVAFTTIVGRTARGKIVARARQRSSPLALEQVAREAC